ncbi:MAG: glycosyltransferase family 2 protein [Lachnospiraceae bacterium]|jgi:glycosyltransferase involved in cell wall biosynthesis|nr:glycosyltransferase family 2 protein [Lachnospiraceae bacterium]
MKNKISVIVPMYNEESSIKKLYEKIVESIKEYSLYEIIFVDDGSADASTQKVKELRTEDQNVRLIVFRKNFGKAAALQAGFRNCSGDIIITMDADLQDDPKEIPRFVAKLEEGYDLVSGWKKKRNDPLEKRLPSKLFNKVTSHLSGVHLHDFNCGFKAYRREVVDSIDVYGELHRYIPVLAYRKGFRIAEIEVEHHAREFGKSKYGFERYLRGLFDSMTVAFLGRFYDRPMYFFGKIGLVLCVLGGMICAYLTALWFMGQGIGNRPLLLLGVLLLILGVQMFSTGFIGDMLVDATYRDRYNESHIKEKI